MLPSLSTFSAAPHYSVFFIFPFARILCHACTQTAILCTYAMNAPTATTPTRTICSTWWERSTQSARLASSSTAARECGRVRNSTRSVALFLYFRVPLSLPVVRDRAIVVPLRCPELWVAFSVTQYACIYSDWRRRKANGSHKAFKLRLDMRGKTQSTKARARACMCFETVFETVFLVHESFSRS